MDTDPWKAIPFQNCGATHYDRAAYYALPGWFMAELRQMASLLSSGMRIDADQRRNMAQRIQAVMDGHRDMVT